MHESIEGNAYTLISNGVCMLVWAKEICSECIAVKNKHCKHIKGFNVHGILNNIFQFAGN